MVHEGCVNHGAATKVACWLGVFVQVEEFALKVSRESSYVVVTILNRTSRILLGLFVFYWFISYFIGLLVYMTRLVVSNMPENGMS